nr:hypothetical protein HK105_003281 [Polyrhizophydium stewartii]
MLSRRHATALLALPALLSCVARAAPNVFGNNRFFYKSLEADGVSFVAGRQFVLGYASTATTVTWANPSNDCTFTLNGATATGSVTAGAADTVSVSCPAAGSQMFTVLRNSDATTTDTFYITLAAAQCFRWFAVYGTAPLAAGSLALVAPLSTAALRIWIADPSNLSAAESAGSATTPSTITSAFAAIGEWPSLSMPKSNSLVLNSSTFSQAGSYWEFTYSTGTGSQVSITITGQNTTLLECSIEPLYLTASITKLSASSLALASSASVGSSATSYFSVYQDACAPNVLLAAGSTLGDGRFVLTQSFFGASDASVLYSLPSTISAGSSVRGIAFTMSSIVALVTNGAAVATASTGWFSSSGLPSTTQLNRVSSVAHCDPTMNRTSTSNLVVAAWDSTFRSQPAATSQTLYVSMDAGASFVAVPINVDKQAAGGGYIRDVVIVHASQSLVVLVRDGSAFDRIVLVPINLSGGSSDGYQFLSSVNPGVILDAGVKGSAPRLTPASSGASDLLLWGDSLFYSPNSGTNVFAVSLISRDPARPAAGLDTTEYIKAVATSTAGRFAALTSTNRVFYGQIGITSAIELAAGIGPSAFASIAFDSLGRLAFLSPQATAPFVSMRIVPAENQVLSTRVPASANPALVCPYQYWKVDAEPEYILDYEQSIPSSGGVYLQKTTSVHIATKAKTYQGRLEVQIRPKEDSLTVDYNCTKFGVPIPLYYGDFFQPVFDVFDGDVYVDTPDVDIALFEYNGRTSFTFNTTMEQAGCRVKAQDWMLLAASSPTAPWDALTSSNYVKCYSSAADGTISRTDKAAAYTIMNGTNLNSVFYCDLTADFAVNVIGAPLFWGYQLLIVLGVCAIGVGVLCYTYWIYAAQQRAIREEENSKTSDSSSANLNKSQRQKID